MSAAAAILPVASTPLAARGIQLRPATDEDEPSLRALYCRHRRPEFAVLGLPEPELVALLTMQFRIQAQQFAANYPNSMVLVGEAQGVPAGRMVLADDGASLLLVDLLVDRDRRGQGIGTALLTAVKAKAAEEGRLVRLHVQHGNPARRLYERLGFRETGQREIDSAMAWAPAEHQPQ